MLEVDPIAQLQADVAALKRKVYQQIRVARVSRVYDSEPWLGYVDVLIENRIEIERRPCLTLRQGEDSTFWLPSENECGMLISPGGEYGNGFFVPGIVFDGFPVDPPDGNPLEKHKIEYRDGQTIEIDVGEHTYTQKIPNADGKLLQEVSGSEHEQTKGRIQDTVGTNKRSLETTKVRDEAGNNFTELTAILLNLLGAHIFPNGVTSFQTAMGPVFFPPVVQSPVAPPTPEAGTTDSDGNVNRIAATDINNVVVRAISTLDLVLPALPVVTSAGSGTTTPGTYRVTATGQLQLTLPSRSL